MCSLIAAPPVCSEWQFRRVSMASSRTQGADLPLTRSTSSCSRKRWTETEKKAKKKACAEASTKFCALSRRLFLTSEVPLFFPRVSLPPSLSLRSPDDGARAVAAAFKVQIKSGYHIMNNVTRRGIELQLSFLRFSFFFRFFFFFCSASVFPLSPPLPPSLPMPPVHPASPSSAAQSAMTAS